MGQRLEYPLSLRSRGDGQRMSGREESREDCDDQRVGFVRGLIYTGSVGSFWE